MKNRTILLVEDDVVDAKTIQRILKKFQVENDLIVFDDGESALGWLEDQETQLPGLILLDLNMPRVDGLEFLDKVKQHELFQLIPVIVLTTSDDPVDRRESFKRNIAGYMLKSMDYHDFEKTISAILEYWAASQLAYE